MFQLFLWIIYIVGILLQLATKNYTGRFDIVQNLCELWQFFLSDFWAQNVLIPPSPKTSKGIKCANTPKLYTTIVANLKWTAV